MYGLKLPLNPVLESLHLVDFDMVITQETCEENGNLFNLILAARDQDFM